MGLFLFGMFVLVCLIGGAYYGLSYLRAKATKKSVVEVINSDVDSVTKKPS
jgi:hypothetical protein